jgi:hypothetical protein
MKMSKIYHSEYLAREMHTKLKALGYSAVNWFRFYDGSYLVEWETAN